MSYNSTQMRQSSPCRTFVYPLLGLFCGVSRLQKHTSTHVIVDCLEPYLGINHLELAASCGCECSSLQVLAGIHQYGPRGSTGTIGVEPKCQADSVWPKHHQYSLCLTEEDRQYMGIGGSRIYKLPCLKSPCFNIVHGAIAEERQHTASCLIQRPGLHPGTDCYFILELCQIAQVSRP